MITRTGCPDCGPNCARAMAGECCCESHDDVFSGDALDSSPGQTSAYTAGGGGQLSRGTGSSPSARLFVEPKAAPNASAFDKVAGAVGEGLATAGIVLISPLIGILSLFGCERAATCGDGVREGTEQCDGKDFGGYTCETFGMSSQGSLSCDEACSVSTKSCKADEATAVPAEDCAERGNCKGGGNIVDDLDWADATTLTDEGQRKNARASGMLTFSSETKNFRCNATIVGPDLIITNSHCVPDDATAATARFHPTTESDVSKDQRVLDSFACDTLVATDCAHDVSILRCRAHPLTSAVPGEAYAIADMDLETSLSPSEKVYLIHTNCDSRNGPCEPRKLLSPGGILSFGEECVTFTGEDECGNCRSDAPQARHTCDAAAGSSAGGGFNASTHKLEFLHWGSDYSPLGMGPYNYGSSIADLAASRPDIASLLRAQAACADEDGDGYGTNLSVRCENQGTDCDDGDPEVNPGAAERCNGIDDDCDGEIDEEMTLPCGSDVGVCEKGARTCEDGAWSLACHGEVKPKTEECNNLDDDCDGQADENVTRACGSDVGECRAGTQTCKSGTFGACVGETKPAAEECNGKDDDCDGVVDDGVDPEQAQLLTCPSQGICAEASIAKSCESGAWKCMMPAGYVENECPVINPLCGFGDVNDPTCSDGADNDCDGVTDENNQYDACKEHPDYWKVEGGLECFVSTVGECGLHGGTYKCVQLAEGCGIAIDCVGAYFPKAEICGNGKDDDCDGSIDNRNDKDLDGFGDCIGLLDCDETDASVHPGGTEVCNGKDDDCDGTFDGLERACGSNVGECRQGVEKCVGGVWEGCYGQVKPSTEVCDNRDNDCDGSVDENLTQSCGSDVGLCEKGIQICSNGSWGTCLGGIQPESDWGFCDGLDHDCDGVPNEKGYCSWLYACSRPCYSNGTCGPTAIGCK